MARTPHSTATTLRTLLVALVAALAVLAGMGVDAQAGKVEARAAQTDNAPLGKICAGKAMSGRAKRIRRLARRAASARKAGPERRLRRKLRRQKSAQRQCRSHRARMARCGKTLAVSAFRVGAPACWRPYSASSPWNRRIPDSPQLHPRSRQIVNRLTSWGEAQQMRAGHADSGGDYDHPIYYSKPGDPVYELRATRDWGTSEIEGHKIRIPAGARPAAGGDAHMAVITEDGWEYDLWTVQRKGRDGGVLRFGWGGRTRIDGDGLGSNATAAHFGLAGGIIRAPELEAERIDHALFMGVKCTDDKGSSVYPAAEGTGEPCTDLGMSNNNAPPLGARFYLDMSYGEIEDLDLPRWKKTILHALAEYGMITGDRFGSGAWGLQMESGSTYTSFGQKDPAEAFARKAGVPEWEGGYLFDIDDGVNWEKNLRMVDPCVSKGTC